MEFNNILTQKEIYSLAESNLISTYNYQRKQVREMKRKANADIERAKQWNILASRFDEWSKETFDKIMQLIELQKECGRDDGDRYE